MKCPKCNHFISDDSLECDCGYHVVQATRDGLCDKCKTRRSKKIITQKATEHRAEKARWVCFDCYHQENGRRFNYSKKSGTYATKEEAAFARALEDYYLRALFYGDEPNYKEIDRAGIVMNKKIYGGL